MEIKLIAHTLTTEHPASHYQSGVLLDNNGGCYHPDNLIPIHPNAKKIFGDIQPTLTAGEIVKEYALNNLLSNDELAFIRRYLSQSAIKSYDLPDNLALYESQIKHEINNIMGDTTQGVHPVYWQRGIAELSVKLFEATDGKYMIPMPKWIDPNAMEIIDAN